MSKDGISFLELAIRLGAYTPVLSALEDAYRKAELEESDAPHGFSWHTSLHVSSMGNPCERYHVLSLMGLPDGDPVEPEGRAIMDAGKDAEVRKVDKLSAAGYLVEEIGELQTGFEYPPAWLTGNCDALLALPGWERPHVLEIKGKDNERDAFKKLASGEMKPEPEHVAQLQGYINMANIAAERWPHLKPCESGSVVYFNRARPFQTLEFFYSIDRDWWKRQTFLLENARHSFMEDELPPHIGDGKGWSEDPCAWCEFKKGVCKPAWKKGLTELVDVAALVQETIDGDYDYEEKRTAVLLRWS